ncbi:class I SAM-dependent methyltransferase [Mesorhizobium sp. 8]|uniref:class I SAM-dependent methyltransferase n=1 Tax=Mesorhizobium sp. 8 TaxID=2584466 RepID=UPI00111E34D4|nr:class I SAM-dependent methyltransferase [Mesorhizobium sp. 8]QDC02840.1 class I SAM-dependent methyltransferase [Mesorhizobium sp. 8]
MATDSLKTLFHPFAAGDLDPPDRNARALFLGAEPGFRLPEGWAAVIHAVQSFRPDFRALERMGLVSVTPRPEGEGYDLALVLSGRHRGRNELNVAEAIERTRAGALIAVAGARDDGIASLRKRLGSLVEIEGSLPKYHGLAFWFRRPAEDGIASALRGANPPVHVENRFLAAPGMFSHDRVDAGSRLLVQNLPGDLAGTVGDFCAGWGYLAAEIARQCPAVAALDLYEADFEALEAAKVNLQGIAPKTAFFWHDLLAEPVEHRYDAVVMNPPFHKGRAAEPDIGAGMIRAAARALKPGGRLLMVANRQLPYEPVLAEAFSSHTEIARDAAFKVLSARR